MCAQDNDEEMNEEVITRYHLDYQVLIYQIRKYHIHMPLYISFTMCVQVHVEQPLYHIKKRIYHHRQKIEELAGVKIR